MRKITMPAPLLPVEDIVDGFSMMLQEARLRYLGLAYDIGIDGMRDDACAMTPREFASATILHLSASHGQPALA